LVIIAVSSALYSAFDNPTGFMDVEWRSSFFQNFSTEMFGAIATYFLFELIVGERSKKQDVLRRLRSKDKATALVALAEICENGWHQDGTLHNAYLTGIKIGGVHLLKIDLRGAEIAEADLSETELIMADLSQVKATSVSLHKAEIISSKLQGIDLRNADLTEAFIERSSLEGALLRNANLEGCMLRDVILTNVDLMGAKIDNIIRDRVILPDGRHWTPSTDMQRFTDPNHPNFWKPPVPQ
jgi:hypothetical protein